MMQLVDLLCSDKMLKRLEHRDAIKKRREMLEEAIILSIVKA